MSNDADAEEVLASGPTCRYGRRLASDCHWHHPVLQIGWESTPWRAIVGR